MPDLGKYADAVLSAYGVSSLLLLLLVVFTLRKGRAARAALEAVEKRKNPSG
ncbi:heme exporter protein CcmD [Roseobacter sp. YSTF-M11]|uniref:Heme exporter protein D n=1 Tax=Roseobacter insulae TaxID=2859783 RepID=A0A9X1FVG1_9RHOB|nr:heme exporter protein CcmD [Roseobacter insulae]MBW4708489.1 heme exporter protein CcmD [Roseobacter insulae]